MPALGCKFNHCGIALSMIIVRVTSVGDATTLPYFKTRETPPAISLQLLLALRMS